MNFLKKLYEAFKAAFKALFSDPSTSLPPPPPKPPVEAVKPVSGEVYTAPAMNIYGNQVGTFRGDPAHPMYKSGDGWKIMLVSYAVKDGAPWDQYLKDRGLRWDLEVMPDHPSIGIKYQ